MIKLRSLLNEGTNWKELYKDSIFKSKETNKNWFDKYSEEWLKTLDSITFDDNRNKLMDIIMKIRGKSKLPLSMLNIPDHELRDMANGKLVVTKSVKQDKKLLCSPNICHKNAAKLFTKDNKIYRVVTGLVVTDDDRVIIHSWVFNIKNNVHYEVTWNFNNSKYIYIGYILSESDSYKFAKVEGFN